MKPKSKTVEILLTALTPVSHHDPAVNDGSNVLTFNRQKQRVEHEGSDQGVITQDKIDAFCAKNPVPTTMTDIFDDVNFTEFTAIALIRLLIDMYNSMDGEGLFSGMGRYSLLESRSRSAAVKSSNLRSFWAQVTKDMSLSIQDSKNDEALLSFFALPASIQFGVVNKIATEYRTIITIARVWHDQTKKQSDDYAQAIGLFQGEGESKPLSFQPEAVEIKRSMVLDVPSVSSNSMRHQLVREPGWLHLFNSLDLGGEDMPVEAEAIFYNGGNIRAGSKQPSNAFYLAKIVRETYPLLDLMGGVCDSFDLGESLLSVASWLVCKENKKAISHNLAGLENSAFDMLDDVTHTRQATQAGIGQMIYNFETLVPGTQFLVRFVLKPYASELATGAFAAAVKMYLENHPTVAGQSARGFGVVSADVLSGEKYLDAEAYETYLKENRDTLREGILTGTLNTPARLLS